MRVLGIGEDLALGDLYRRMGEQGHEVRVFVSDPRSQGVMAGVLQACARWESELDWVRAAGDDGLILFETACHGEIQDQLRREGFAVIGGSAWGDRLESDRAYGQQVLRDLGMQTARTHAFRDYEAGIAFVRRQPGRYVYKRSDPHALSTRTYVGQLDDGRDLLAQLQLEAVRNVPAAACEDNLGYVLMEHVEGIEVGVGAYFDGQEFLRPVCIDWEHKRFFAGDLGELTAEMGTVVSYRGGEALFAQTLERLAVPLRQAGHVGYLNLNLILNDAGLWPLEFTARFGYPGYSICSALHREPWSQLFRRMLRQIPGPIATRKGYSVGVVLSAPPFPYEGAQAQDTPVFFREPLSIEERDQLHFADMARTQEQWRLAGPYGYAMVVTGIGVTVAGARQRAYALASKVVIPNLRYRVDIGQRLIDRDLQRMAELGYPQIGVRFVG